MTSTQQKLYEIARDAAENAYAPYSEFSVGAAILTASGEIIAGCNVENGSYGLGLCAERNAITTAVAKGCKPGDIKELVIYIDHDELFSPCGGCRQVMNEFMPANAPVTSYNAKGESQSWTMRGLLPDGFVMPED